MELFLSKLPINEKEKMIESFKKFRGFKKIDSHYSKVLFNLIGQRNFNRIKLNKEQGKIADSMENSECMNFFFNFKKRKREHTD